MLLTQKFLTKTELVKTNCNCRINQTCTIVSLCNGLKLVFSRMSKKENVPIETEGKLAQLNQIEQRIAEAIKNAGKVTFS